MAAAMPDTLVDNQVRTRTIQDFGNQWQRHGKVDADHWSSVDMFRDHFGDLFDPAAIEGRQVAEVGSGSGRIVNMIAAFKPARLHAIEPSAGMEVLKRNTAAHGDTVHYVRATGDSFDIGGLDLVFSLGVIHHIKDPRDVVKNIHRNLKPGGRFLIWVYGHEGNGAYLAVYRTLATVTKRMPDAMLDRFSGLLNYLIEPYVWLCRRLPLPLSGYLSEVFGKCGWEKRRYIIFDQLNPAYAKYYRRAELEALLREVGFDDVRLYHRHGYSWTAVATKAGARDADAKTDDEAMA